MRKWNRAIGLLAALSLLAAACGDDDDDDAGGATTTEGAASATSAAAGDVTTTEGTEPATSSSTEPSTSAAPDEDEEACAETEAGTELTFGVRNEPRGFDPIAPTAAGSAGGNETTAVFDTIMRYNPETGEVEPRMAESLEPNDDLTEWTLTLRDGITFDSGAPFDAAAVEYNVSRHNAPDSTSTSKALASLIESMEIVDDLTMVFRLTAPSGNFPSVLAGNVGKIADPAELERLGAEAFAADPQGGGAGPYRLVRWAPNEEMVLEARDDYWGGPVCTETLRFVRIEDNAARYDAFANGEIDAAFMRSPADAARAREDGANIAAQFQNGGLLLMVNNRAPDRPGADLRVRQAIAHALDPAVIDERFTGGLGVPSSAMVPESSVLYSEGVEGLEYDPDQARALLDEVKAETGYDGSLHFLCNTTYSEAALAIEGLLEAVGFVVENDSGRSVQDWVGIIVASPDYDVTCHSLGLTDAQPWEKLQLVLGTTEGPASPGYVNPEMDEAMNALREAVTVEERQEAFAEVQRVWNETVPSAVYAHVEEDVIWSDNVEGLEFSMETVVLFDKARVTG